MRVLFTVPHYYHPAGATAAHGSLSAAARAARVRVLRLLVTQLHALFGRRRYAIQHQTQELVAANDPLTFEFDLLIFTTEGRHLLGDLGLPAGMYTHVETKEEGKFLGFACHEAMVQRLGGYDYYCYLEDDIVLFDPMFFLKLQWFNAAFADAAQPLPLLQPQRFEVPGLDPQTPVDAMMLADRVYIDYAAATPKPQDRQTIEIAMFGHTFNVERTTLPHAGCFFLNQRQMEYLAQQPVFLDRKEIWVSPLDTAATLAIAQTFPVFKGALDSLAFFEVCHAHPSVMPQLEAGTAAPVWRHPGQRG